MASGIPTRDIWGMFPTTVQLEEKKAETMQTSAAYFGQAQQGTMLGQGFMPTPQFPVSPLPAPGHQQTLPIGLIPEWEIEHRSPYTIVPAIEYGGIKLGQVPIVVAPNDELEKRVGIMQAHPFANPGLLPVKMNGRFVGQQPATSSPTSSGGPSTAALAIGGGLLTIGGVALYAILK